MAEVKVEKKKESEGKTRESQAMERQPRGGGISRQSEFFPSSLWRSPGDFFTTNPFALMRRWNEEMDRFLGGSWAGFGGGETGAWSPAVEVSERAGKMIVSAELPGLNKDDVKVEVTDEAVVIQGERKREHEEHRGGYHRSERSYGSFYRAIPLPEGAKAEEARAQFNNGVLEVSIPVPEEKRRGREIPIEAGSGERKPIASELSGQKKESQAG
jgi:HSP20 family protein